VICDFTMHVTQWCRSPATGSFASPSLRSTQTGDRLHELLHGKVAAAALPHEWLQGTYLSVDLPPGTDPTSLVEALEAPARAGALRWEIDS